MKAGRKFDNIRVRDAHPLFAIHMPNTFGGSSVDIVNMFKKAYATGTLVTNENVDFESDTKFVIYFDYEEGYFQTGYIGR